MSIIMLNNIFEATTRPQAKFSVFGDISFSALVIIGPSLLVVVTTEVKLSHEE